MAGIRATILNHGDDHSSASLNFLMELAIHGHQIARLHVVHELSSLILHGSNDG